MVTQLDREGDLFVLSTATHRWVIRGAGARIVEYSVGGKNVISQTGSYVQQGSTFWVAPQRDWPEAWPPSAILDEGPYREVEGGGRGDLGELRLVSDVDPDLGVSFEKAFTMHQDGSVRVRYTVRAARDVEWAPWEVTRLRPGLCVYGRGAYRESIVDPAIEAIETVEDEQVCWVPFASGNDRFRTHLGDVNGWCAYAHDGLLLLKQCPTVAAASFAPGNGSLKIWWQNSDFIELEELGPSQALAAGEHLVYDVAWSLRPLGPEVEVAPGSASLAALLPL